MDVLVTGAPGFIGSHLCRALAEEGHRVRGLAFPGEPTEHLAEVVTDWRTGDITEPESLQGVFDGIDLVYHLAARVLDYGTKKQFFGPIVDGTRNVVEAAAAAGVQRFIHLSSFVVCGLGTHMKGRTEDDLPVLTGMPYVDAKVESESIVRATEPRFKDGAVIIRPSHVVGPGSVWVVEPLRQFQNARVPLIDHGQYPTGAVHVESLVDGLVRAGIMPEAAGQTYHLRDDWDATWQEYLTELGGLIGKEPKGDLPFRLAWTVARTTEPVFTRLGRRPPVTRSAVAMMGRDNDVDNSKAKRELGWKTLVSYEDAMAGIAEWVQANPERIQ